MIEVDRDVRPRPRHIHYLTSNTLKKPLIKARIKICSKCHEQISLSDRKKHRCSSSTPSLSHSVYRAKRKTNAQTQRTTTDSTPTFQQHVRDHALNAKVDIHCPYCVMHSSSRPIERRSDSSNTVLQVKKKLDRLKRANRPSKTLPLYSLSTSKPPMKLEFNKKPNSQNQLQVSMAPCVVDPKISSKLESGKMNH